MQIFITGSPLETAEALDARRLNKQIIECRQILAAIDGTSKAWSNHPVYSCTVRTASGCCTIYPVWKPTN